jgi:hypothetical protein
MYRALAVSPMGEVALAVREVAGEDWRGRVRISTDAMEELALKEGDVVEVEGSRLTAALAARGPPEDLGARTIRMDVWTARNAGVEAGGTVKVRKAKAAPAAVIVLETQTILEPSESFKSYVKSRLLGRPVVAGDVVPVNVLGAIYELRWRQPSLPASSWWTRARASPWCARPRGFSRAFLPPLAPPSSFQRGPRGR